MTFHELHFDVGRSLLDDRSTGHNRFHPDVEPLLVVASGDVASIDVRDGFDTQIGPHSTAEDILHLDLQRGHAMTGPIAIEGAEPGDVLEVEILDLETAGFGYTMVIPGIGLLGDRFARPFLVKWTLTDGRARSADMPGVTIGGRPFLGVVAVAPSAEFVHTATAREQALASEHLVALPDPTRAVPEHAGSGLRTLPPRENGGNLDVRHVAVGARVGFTVQVPGALFSVGDPHFAQGDGESSGVAIETAARVRLRFHVRKDPPWRPRHPFITTGKHVVSTGISVDAAGENRYLDVYTAAAAAAGDMLEYVQAERGLSAEQAYVLLSVAVDLQISELVDAPNAVVSAVLPLDVFE